MPVYQNPKTKKYYYSCYFTDWQGNRKKKKKEGFNLAREAKAAEREFLALYAQNPDISFSALYTHYIEDCKARLKPTTLLNKISIFNKHLLPAFGKLSITDITPATIRKWQNTILKQELSAAYIQGLNTNLSAIFNYAVRYYGLEKNPVTIAGHIGKTIRRVDFWTLEEFQAAIQHTKPAYKLPFMLLFYTGLRAGEMLALTLEDYSATDHTVRINKTYARVHQQDILQPPKTPKSNRTVTLPDIVCDLLDEYIKTLYKPQPNTRIFEQYGKTALNKQLSNSAKRAGLKKNKTARSPSQSR